MVPTAHCENDSVKKKLTTKRWNPALNRLIAQYWHYQNTICPCRCCALLQRKTLGTVLSNFCSWVKQTFIISQPNIYSQLQMYVDKSWGRGAGLSLSAARIRWGMQGRDTEENRAAVRTQPCLVID
ncbi:hypothetical protein Y032_0100g3322 [Ancylostoma ceylanicum]|uniref:Uncharacterized protein n=1 Tax=Ancylostoma ceylanicum TaxID=53326 RepID=A0A016TID2_9BILA|nr:hypothetical protein Y032_0100g3322 [Ancylostoma ceylanicum]